MSISFLLPLTLSGGYFSAMRQSLRAVQNASIAKYDVNSQKRQIDECPPSSSLIPPNFFFSPLCLVLSPFAYLLISL